MEQRDPSLCTGFAREGEPCRMRRLTGSDFCFWHDPERLAARAEARGDAPVEHGLPADTLSP